jgi:hypothetical protein
LKDLRFHLRPSSERGETKVTESLHATTSCHSRVPEIKRVSDARVVSGPLLIALFLLPALTLFLLLIYLIFRSFTSAVRLNGWDQ